MIAPPSDDSVQTVSIRDRTTDTVMLQLGQLIGPHWERGKRLPTQEKPPKSYNV